jgi:hypothetical protein
LLSFVVVDLTTSSKNNDLSSPQKRTRTSFGWGDRRVILAEYAL